MLKRLLIASSLACVCFASSACDGADSETDAEVRQLQDADVTLEDALEAVGSQTEDAVVLEAEFFAGVDEGYYAVLAVDGDELVVFEVDADRPQVREVDRRRAGAERLARARAHRHLRRRLVAALEGELRERSSDERPVRARLFERDVELELMNRRGLRRRLRLAFND